MYASAPTASAGVIEIIWNIDDPRLTVEVSFHMFVVWSRVRSRIDLSVIDHLPQALASRTIIRLNGPGSSSLVKNGPAAHLRVLYVKFPLQPSFAHLYRVWLGHFV